MRTGASVLHLHRLLLSHRSQCRLPATLRHNTHPRFSRAPPRWTRTHSILTAATTATLAFSLPSIFAPSDDSDSDLVSVPKLTHPDVPKTIEQRLLEASESERREAKRVSKDQPKRRRALQTLKIVVLDYILEPIATGLRFVSLVVIFVPVIVAIPMVCLGRRDPKRSDERAGTMWWYAFLVHSMETAGATFIKLGQWAASRSDIFPTELCDMMSKLHSNSKAHAFSETKRIISEAFDGLPFEEIFEEFDEAPLGVGAIAQVYKAKIKSGLVPPPPKAPHKDFRATLRDTVDGLVKYTPGQAAPSNYVAVKVVHPNVDKTVNRDLRIMRFFALMLNSIPTLEWLSFPDEVDTFSDMMRLQMDLRIEAENLAKFRNNFATRTTVTFPMPYRQFTTRDVLIEEFAEGIPLSKFLERGAGVYQEEIANMGLDAFLHMLVIDNFIHSDLHPGNIMVRFLKPTPPPFPFLPTTTTTDATAEATDLLSNPSTPWLTTLSTLSTLGYRPQLLFLDTGLVTELNAPNRRNFLDLFRAIAEFDGFHAGELMISRSRSPETVLHGEVFALKMEHLVLSVKSRTLALGNISFGDIISQVLSMVRTHHVRMEGDFVNVVLSMLLLEGIGRALDPELDLLMRYVSSPSLPLLRQVGAGSGREVVRAGMKGGLAEGGLGSLLKVWVALEARQFVNTTVKEMEELVKYDRLSPNI
ncbi:ABC1-domain-containing protein [Ascodesmis nigricans]|uniref:ABC1-domain-containing protein n=1 Tax=Ascodesmis nigricans TaxID=341454 RepID=A0A4S2N0Y5_9PEZI|nr:ABC1-domain-containing protein [Ascodesmis nigricans]